MANESDRIDPEYAQMLADAEERKAQVQVSHGRVHDDTYVPQVMSDIDRAKREMTLANETKSRRQAVKQMIDNLTKKGSKNSKATPPASGKNKEKK